jgi:hypothetical protein
MHVRHCGGFHPRRSSAPLLPLQALPAPLRYYALNDRPMPRGRVLRGGRRGQGPRLGPGDGWLKAFCVDCGSHKHTISPDVSTLVAIRLGRLDQDPGIRPQPHQFVAYASPA